ncbi:MAG: hypothetical protein AB9846_08775 [Tenuifilaceae bacterium]
MIITNKLDSSFGPVGSTAGVFMFFAGIAVLYYSFFGVIIACVGAFIGFSSSCTSIDTEKKRIRFSNNIFGFIKTGKWIEIEPTMKIGIKKSSRAWRAYSRGNESLDIVSKDFRIFLFDSNNKMIMPIKKVDSNDSAKADLEILSKQLGLGVI